MRKQKQGRKFGRKRDQRKALLKALATAVISEEKIKTTEARAKEISGVVDKYITKAKKGGLSSQRLLISYLGNKTTKKLIDDIAPRYKDRNGGYSRIIKLGPRKSDSAKMAIIELIK